MNTIDIFMKLQSLPEDMQTEATHYIEFLQQKAKASNQLKAAKYPDVVAKLLGVFQKHEYVATDSPTPQKRVAGLAKGLVTMSDDFDEPLDDFNEYMP